MLDLPALGPVRVRRASYVEFDPRCQQWTVRLARPQGWWRRLAYALLGWPRGQVLHRASRREAALAWEKQHLGPAAGDLEREAAAGVQQRGIITRDRSATASFCESRLPRGGCNQERRTAKDAFIDERAAVE